MNIVAITSLGRAVLHLCEALGGFVLFVIESVGVLFSTRLNTKQLFLQMQHIGVDSVAIISLTGFSSGLALAFQTNIGFSRFGIQDFIGTVVALGMTRELGPVLTGIMVTGRAGSAIAAEIGTMKITEQIDALRTVCLNPFQYLIVPRLVASVLILPCLSIFSMMMGILGGYVYCTQVIHINPDLYISGIEQFVSLSDICGGLIKSSCFGLITALIATFQGYHAVGGARGVGIATTRTVVMASILILIANYFLSAFLNEIGLS